MKYGTSLIAAAALALAGGAAADDDHEAARRLREQGRIVPLEVILETMQGYDGTLLEVELEREGKEGLVYEVELLDSQGRVRELLFDAETGELIEAREEGH